MRRVVKRVQVTIPPFYVVSPIQNYGTKLVKESQFIKKQRRKDGKKNQD